MTTATATIVDNTGSTVTLTIDLDGVEDSPTAPASPPPSTWDDDTQRAIVKHGIPTREGDIGQDMGSNSITFDLSGLCNLADKATLKAMAAKAQFTAGYPAGIITLTMANSASTTIYDESGIAILRARFHYVGGLHKMFRFTITFGRFYGQTGV
jgi:hypothetical protein